MWDERYSEDGFAYGTEPNTFLKESLQRLQDDFLFRDAPPTCLMLAEGEGRNAVYMAQLGFQVTGVDISQVGLDKAQRLAKSRGVKITTVLADLSDYDLGHEQWDIIVGISCHLPPAIREKVLSAIPFALKPNGAVIFETYTPDQLKFKTGGPSEANMMYSAEIFRQAFGNGQLVVERNEESVRDVVEGKYHKGKAAVVQFVGRK